MIPAHRASGDAVKGLALNVLVQHELPRNGKRTLPVGGHGRPIAAAEKRPQRGPVRSIAQAVPQQAIQIAPGPIQVHGGVQDLGCIREIGDLGLVGLIRSQEDLHPQPLVRKQVQRRLQQSAYRPVHLLPVIGATIQGIEQHEKIHALPVELGVAFLEQAVDGVRILRDVPRSCRPRVAFPKRVLLFARALPGQNRAPDSLRLEVGHQPSQFIRGGVLVRRRPGAEARSHLGVLVQRRQPDEPTHQLPHRPVLQRAPPEGLAGAPHAGHELNIRVQRLDVGRRQVDVGRRRRDAVARAFGQGQKRLAHRSPADGGAHPRPPLPVMRRPSKRRRKSPYAWNTGVASRSINDAPAARPRVQ